MNDPDGLMFPHLQAITPQLKNLFARAFVSIPSETAGAQPEHVAWLATDSFFDAIVHSPTITSVGDDFLTLYARAAEASDPDQVLHLCYIDRVAFALRSTFRDDFIADMQRISQVDTPLIFQRSDAAWETHPRNYREIEQIATKVGAFLFGKSLDFAWCHLAIQAHRLQQILPHIKRRDLSMAAEFVLRLAEEVQTREVDWLAWEDPFILSRDADQLRRERENSSAEIHKRLAYVIPMLQLLNEASLNLPPSH